MSAPNLENQNADESSAFYANNDASSYNMRYLKSIRNKDRFHELHFYEAPTDLIDELFPKKPSKGTLDPPKVFCASAKKLMEWRDLEEVNQLQILESERQKNAQDNQKIIESGIESGQLKRTLEATVEVKDSEPAPPVISVPPPAPPAKQPKLEEEHKQDFPDQWGSLSMDINVDFRKDRVCHGLTLEYMRRAYPNVPEIQQGFSALVAKAMRYKADVYASDNSWPFAPDPRIIGAIVDQNFGVVTLFWICVQLAESTKGDSATNLTKFDTIYFHHPTCDRSSLHLLCDKCKDHANDFLELLSLSAKNDS